MKYSVFTALVAVSLLLFANAAQAADSSHPYYIGAKGDIAFPSKTDVKGASTGSVDYGFSSGAGVTLGWQPPALDTSTGDVRAEFEAGYHAMGLDRVLTNNNASGDFKATTLMGNVYYDVHTGSSFTPYVGAGLGQAFVRFPTGKGLGNTDDSDNVLAYQAMAGVSYTPESMPRTALSVGYKYLGFESPSFKTAGSHVKLDSPHESAVEFGVRYRF